MSVDELVVQDGSCKFMLRAIVSLIFHANQTALAKDFAVLLSGDLPGISKTISTRVFSGKR
jgi:hypothetical protein